MDRIVYSKFAHYVAKDADLDEAPDFEFPFVPGSRFRAVNTGIDEPACQVNFEDFYKGKDIPWTLFHDEVQVVLSGHGEIEYWLPPLFTEHGKVTVGPGSVYLMPRGCRVVWRVLSDEPLRHICVTYPNPGYPIPRAASIAERKG